LYRQQQQQQQQQEQVSFLKSKAQNDLRKNFDVPKLEMVTNIPKAWPLGVSVSKMLVKAANMRHDAKPFWHHELG